ncbi:MAG: LuxR C-terminal-related transcriptional regulator, partial [Flavobacteriales bacterium]|nr:LuxR C-terminal-related transcriptional regulator [Flavobacteriales bacterium]
MQEEVLMFPQEIYSAYLTIINDVKFSKREIDIISCILNGRSAKGIAHFLSISPKTVESHTYRVMKKLDCSSREGLISIMEKSDKILILKKHYFNLLTFLDFKKYLKDISMLSNKKEINCLIVCWEGEGKISLLNKLKSDLELAGIKISFEIREKWKSLTYLISEVSSEHYIIYVLPSRLLITNNEKDKNIFQSDKRVSSLLHKTLFLSLDKEVFDQLYLSIDPINCINYTKEGYYFSIFKILERFVSHEGVKPLIQDFKIKYGSINNSSNIEPSAVIVDKKRILFYFNDFILQRKWLFLILIVICGIGLTAKISETNFKVKEENQNKSSEKKVETRVRSDLNLPKDITLLNRFELMNQIDKKFKNQEGVQIVALVGMGGAGKTTLARHYAHQQEADVVWEINAETHKSLLKSFDSFAQALIKKEQDQRILREIRDTKNPAEKEERYIQFVKEHLKVHSNWLLIFDNVEKLADIQKYLPQDVMTWGQGKVLLTTQNSNIQNNKYVNSSVL